MPIRTEPSPFLSSSKPMNVPGVSTFQSAGTSKAVPHFGFTTTFQPSIVGFSPSPPRGLSSPPVPPVVGEADADADALGDVDGSPPAASSLPPPSTTAAVTPAAITTAEAATIAVIFVLLPPPPPPPLPPDGCGPPIGTVGAHCW